jgi:hypothetical protein
MSGLFGGGPSAPAPPPPVPTLANPAVLDAERQQEASQAQAAGRASTLLTSGTGVTSQPTLAKKTLLGG